jgi:type I restriction enzyme S subunit
MNDWITTRLSDVADIIPGYAFKGKDFGSNGEPIIKIKNLNENKINFNDIERIVLNEEQKFKLNKYLVRKNDFVIAMTGATIGKIGKMINNEHAYINQRVAKIIPKNFIEHNFIYYLVLHDFFYQYIINNVDSNTAQENISATTIGDYSFSLPPLPEQKAIASVLSSLDDKIDLLHRQNITIEGMAETLFKQWFVVEANDDWEETTIGDYITCYDNLRIPLSSLERNKMKYGPLYPYYGAAKIVDYINDFIFNGEYLLIAEDGTVRTDDGYPILQLVSDKFWVNNHTHVLQAKSPYTNFIIYIYLRKYNIDSSITGAVQPKINQENLFKIKFINYPHDLINRYNSIVLPIENKIKINKNNIILLQKIRDLLLPHLLNGNVQCAL